MYDQNHFISYPKTSWRVCMSCFYTTAVYSVLDDSDYMKLTDVPSVPGYWPAGWHFCLSRVDLFSQGMSQTSNKQTSVCGETEWGDYERECALEIHKNGQVQLLLNFWLIFEQKHGVIILDLNYFEIKFNIANMLIMDKMKWVVCCVFTVTESSELAITRHWVVMFYMA